MGIQRTPIEVPEGVEPYVFGSILTDLSSASDIDVVFVYDPGRIDPSNIYSVLAPLRLALAEHFGRPVHPVVLSKMEEASDCFRKRVESVPLREWIDARDRGDAGF